MGEIATALGASSVIGELIAGIIIGPSLLGWVEANEVIHILAEIGVILVLFFAWFAHWFGAPELLGGFAAGLALSRRFFLPFGLAMQSKHGFSLTLVTVAIFGKFTGALLINEPLSRRIVIGMAMVPSGEVGLIFAGLGSAAGLLTGDVYTALIIVIAYTTLLSPFWIKQYYRHFGRYL